MIFFILIWSLTCLAFFALACSISKHQKQIFNRPLDVKQTHLATIAGWSLLIISLMICLMVGKISNMVSYWVGALTFSALFVGLCLSYFPTRIQPITCVCIAITLLSGIIYFI